MAALQALASKIPEQFRRLRSSSSDMDGSSLTTLPSRLGNMRGAGEFFAVNRLSRPQDMNEATRRISHNTRYFGANYTIIVAILAVYALLTNPLLLLALLFVVGGFIAINRLAPEPTQVGNHVVTQKGLYTCLFVIGIPLLWLAAPLSTLFWIVGSSAVLVLAHASILEPGVEVEYGSVEVTDEEV